MKTFGFSKNFIFLRFTLFFLSLTTASELLYKQSFCYAFSNQDIQNKNEIWNSEQGLKFLAQSQFKNDFYQLANFYQPQENPTLCGVASAVIVMNSLLYKNIPSQKLSEIIKPNGDVIPYKLFTQDSFFNDKSEKIKAYSVLTWRSPKKILIESDKEEKVFDPGLSLKELGLILSKAHGLSVKTYHFSNLSAQSLENLRLRLKKLLVEKDSFIIANFDGQVLGNQSRGHFSPLAAYDEISDRVLVLDVGLYLNQWFWVPVTELTKAMNTKDSEQFRGYLVVSK